MAEYWNYIMDKRVEVKHKKTQTVHSLDWNSRKGSLRMQDFRQWVTSCNVKEMDESEWSWDRIGKE